MKNYKAVAKAMCSVGILKWRVALDGESCSVQKRTKVVVSLVIALAASGAMACQ
jgi:hypothetical protein